MNNILRLLGISLLGLGLAACNLQPAMPSESEIESQANFFRQFGANLNIRDGYAPSIDLDSSGNPVVAWFDGPATFYDIYVKRWNGSNWVQLGTALNVNRFAVHPSLSLDTSGNPVVAWEEQDDFEPFSWNVYVNRWDGNSWLPLGGALDIDSTQDANNPSLSLDSSGNPVVAWDESGNIYVKRWNGTGWVQMGPALDTSVSQNATNPSLAVTSFGSPVVAWEEYDGTSRNIYIRSYITLPTGSFWTPITTPLDVTINSDARDPSVAVDSAGNPSVSWSEDDDTSWNIYVKEARNGIWSLVGNTFLDVNTNRDANSPSLALDSSGNPVVSWSESDNTSRNIYVKRWNGSTWAQIGNIWNVNTNVLATSPSLVLDRFGNPVVSWPESGKIYVKGYYKNAFKQLGGILDIFPSADATDPSIALGNNNQPVVAWTEFSFFSNNSTDIYVRRWTTGWTPALGPVDTVSSRNVYSPALAVEKSSNVNAFNPVIAWEEDNGSNRDIYVKRWNGTAWTNYGTGTPLDKSAANSASQPLLVLDSNNRPYVTWTERVGTTNNIYVKRWTGTAWVWVGGNTGLDFSLSNEAGFPSLAIGSDNIPVVAWAEENTTTFNANIYVKHLVGNTWTLVGTTAIDRSLANYATSPSLDLDSSNNPIVTWEEQLASGDSNIYAKRWNGSSWVSLGNILDKVSSHPTSFPTLVIGTNNNPVVSWTEFDLPGSDSYNVYVKRWTGTAWQSVSTGAVDVNLANNADKPSMVLNAANNPVVAWQESIGPSELNNIYVKGF